MPDANFTLLIVIIILAVGFGFINGLNDAANAIATAIGTRAMSPRSAVIMASIFNFAGAATGLEVARTIGKGILIQGEVTFITMIAALASVIIWGLLATYRGLPVSITHSFVAGLAAAGIAAAGGDAVMWGKMARVMSAVITAPLLGFIGGSSDRPAPISQKEADQILNRVKEGVDKPRPKVLFEPGEVVRVTDGPFNDFSGVVEQVHYEKSRLQVAVQILGRSTPVELDFSQVEKG